MHWSNVKTLCQTNPMSQSRRINEEKSFHKWFSLNLNMLFLFTKVLIACLRTSDVSRPYWRASSMADAPFYFHSLIQSIRNILMDFVSIPFSIRNNKPTMISQGMTIRIHSYPHSKMSSSVNLKVVQLSKRKHGLKNRRERANFGRTEARLINDNCLRVVS